MEPWRRLLSATAVIAPATQMPRGEMKIMMMTERRSHNDQRRKPWGREQQQQQQQQEEEEEGRDGDRRQASSGTGVLGVLLQERKRM